MRNFDLCGRGQALVTDAARGLGFALAAELKKRGFDIIITGRDEKTLQAAAEKLGAVYYVCDLAAKDAAQSLCEAADALDRHLSQEFAAVHLHAALETLGQITGAQTDERLLDEIFSHFCVGK